MSRSYDEFAGTEKNEKERRNETFEKSKTGNIEKDSKRLQT